MSGQQQHSSCVRLLPQTTLLMLHSRAGEDT